MTDQPSLQTERLYLRPLSIEDTTAIQAVASLREIADTMISIPHPYPHGEAERYIAQKMTAFADGHCITFAIESQASQAFCGIIEVRDIESEHSQAELSFWLTPATWGCGYMSETLDAVVRFVFESLELNRLYAYHMVRNPDSGRVLKKSGFVQEGILRQRVRKWGVFEDVALLAILHDDWQRSDRERGKFLTVYSLYRR